MIINYKIDNLNINDIFKLLYILTRVLLLSYAF